MTGSDGPGASGNRHADHSDLRAMFVNCTLKRSPEGSNTEGLARIAMDIMRRQGVTVDEIRAVDHDIARGRVARHDRARLGP